jgi:predicted O-methyltransferase YrrM
MNKVFAKNGIKLILKNPKLLRHIFSLNMEKMHFAYFENKLNLAREYYDKIKDVDASDRKVLLDALNKISKDILQKESLTLESELIIMYLLVRKLRPTVMIETGVQKGGTSLFILSAMADNQHGKLYSIELPFSEYVDDDGRVLKETVPPDTIGVFVPEKLRDRWELTLGDSKIELPRILDKLSEIDIFFHDSNHTYEHMIFEFEASWPYIKKNGIIISDDVSNNDAFAKFTKDRNVYYVTPSKTNEHNSDFGILFKQ